MNALVLYYSYSGNTAGIALEISEALGCDLAEIETVAPYSNNFNAVVKQSEKEIKNGYEPEIKPLAHNPADYDTVILGFPVWWYTFAPPVKTALSGVNWTGKTVYAFATNAGWLGHSFADVKKACGGADVKPGMDIRFDADQLVTPQAELDRWIDRIRARRTHCAKSNRWLCERAQPLSFHPPKMGRFVPKKQKNSRKCPQYRLACGLLYKQATAALGGEFTRGD